MQVSEPRRDALKQNGLVRKVVDGQVVVSLAGGIECSSCEGRHTCFSMSSSGNRKIEVTLTGTVSASVGDMVEVELLPRASMMIITVSFLMPVLMLLAGYAIAMPAGVVQGAIGAGIGITAGITASIILNRKLSRRKDFDLRIVRIVEKPECPPGVTG